MGSNINNKIPSNVVDTRFSKDRQATIDWIEAQKVAKQYQSLRDRLFYRWAKKDPKKCTWLKKNFQNNDFERSTPSPPKPPSSSPRWDHPIFRRFATAWRSPRGSASISASMHPCSKPNLQSATGIEHHSISGSRPDEILHHQKAQIYRRSHTVRKQRKVWIWKLILPQIK